ncbi:sugar transferase [Nordella sp. HKS 07]|uniref:sugar transferase n=1 Tax=Nordella sp. HKS 07 TaxID=2712222 RepID=UPI001FEE17BC|nr:sugar transferase [Nordella sp. HKS 07]
MNAESASASSGFDTTLLSKSNVINGSVVKRWIDVLIASLAIIVLLPVGLLVALAIKIESPGPILFWQQRYGRNRSSFYICKFRSMTVAESKGDFTQASRNDTRVTRVGKFLRSTSLDELPQLYNVLRGEMSLVGPRPHAIAMDDAFAEVISNFNDRHLVRPGLTGLAQVSGFRGPTEALEHIQYRVHHDRLYISKWSVLLDMKILVRTFFALTGPNAV